jgi:hypothetical protein
MNFFNTPMFEPVRQAVRSGLDGRTKVFTPSLSLTAAL